MPRHWVPDADDTVPAEVFGLGSSRLSEGEIGDSGTRQFSSRKKNFNGEKLWARGYAVSTVGFDEEQVRRYIRRQEQLDAQGSEEDGEF